MSRCYSCCQENCGTVHCACSCHNEKGDWESYQAMLEDILRHRLATGERIVCEDDPKTRRFVYHALPPELDPTSKTWSIRVPVVQHGPRITGVFAQFYDDSKYPERRILKRGLLLEFINRGGLEDPDLDLEIMDQATLLAEAKKLRAGIRKHRDATGHNLCWYVPELWGLLPDRVEPKPEVPPREEFLRCCAEYRTSLDGVKT